MPKQYYVDIRDYGKSSIGLPTYGIFIIEIEAEIIKKTIITITKPLFIHNPHPLDRFKPGERILVESDKIYIKVPLDIKQSVLRHLFKI